MKRYILVTKRDGEQVSYERNDIEKFVTDTGATDDQAIEAFSLDNGRTTHINAHWFKCKRLVKIVSGVQHEVVELREMVIGAMPWTTSEQR